MKGLRLRLLVLGWVAACAVASAQTPTPAPAATTVLQEIDRTIRDGFFDPKFKGIDWSGTLDKMGEMGGGVMTMINGEVSRQAMMIAFLDNFYMLTWVLLAFAPLPLLLRKPKPPGAGEKLPVME